MKLNLSEIFALQKKLDKHIHMEHSVSYVKIIKELKLALIVELAETANEIRSFKFWSYKKPSEKSIILEEYVDGIHFITSLCIFFKIEPIFIINVQNKFNSKKEITESFIDLFKTASNIVNAKQAKLWYKKYLEFAFNLGFNFDDIFKSYKKKCEINHQRQINKY